MELADSDVLDIAKQKLLGLQTGTLYARQAAEELCELLANEPSVTFKTLNISVQAFTEFLITLSMHDPYFQRSLQERLPDAVRYGDGAEIITITERVRRAS